MILRHLFIFALLACAGTALGQPTRVRVDYKDGFDKTTDSMLTVAVRLIDSVVNSDLFAQKVKQASFKRNQNKTNEAILAMIRNGTAPGNPDHVIHLKVAVYNKYAGGGEVGVTVYDTKMKTYITRTFRGYIMANGAACYAAHLMHEYCHVMGFTHPKLKFLGHAKAKSVPYVIGDIVADILGVKCP
ncbi:hypothetical protein [Taibaiella chishuiensis]|uniref:Uncharacterized protein n=1 Tax=Taibaiella chishuiensis TaxID=1434707 RepID=A0A2P8D216_9BACT|nr:hypothetical protein [Taibaiella chishuiensis]PSK91247.1 hypothetical protein B0I18_106259 [Taibaiella chishuiensis]